MKIIGIEGMTADELKNEVDRGGSFVVYQYCISVVLMTFRRSSSIYFIKAGHSRSAKGMPFTILSVLLGWWGIPWGPIWTVQALVKNSGGGKNVTHAVLSAMAFPAKKASSSPAPIVPRPLPTQRQKHTL